jgi:hypothetical protein
VVYRVNFLYQGAVLPSHWAAILVAGPNLIKIKL